MAELSKAEMPRSGGGTSTVLLIFLGALLLFTFQLGATSLWDADEPLYTEIAREIAESGDWVTTRFNGEHWFCHPPLYFWLTALTGTLLGWTEFSARLWSALFGAALVALTWLLGLRLSGRRIGAAGAAILVASLHLFGISRIALLDTCMVFFLTAALYCFALGYSRGESKYFYGFWLACAFATLAKGPFGFFFPTGVAFLFLLGRRELTFIGRMKLIPGLAIYLAIASPWYAAGLILHGRAFYDSVFDLFIFRRVVAPILNQGGPWYYYVPILAAGFLPWVTFLPQSLVFLWKRRDEPFSLLLLLWIVPTFVFFSLAGTKLPNYILIMYPAMALAVASFLDYETSPERRSSRSLVPSLVLLVLITCAVCVYIVVFGTRSHPGEYARMGNELRLLGITLFSGYMLAFLAALLRKRYVLPALAVTNVLVFAVLLTILPRTEEFKPIKPLALSVRSQLADGDTLAIVAGVDGNNSLVFYTGRHVKLLCNEEEQVNFLSSGKPFFCMMNDGQWSDLRGKLPPTLRVMERRNRHCIVTNRAR